jgi:hypothetical protein
LFLLLLLHYKLQIILWYYYYYYYYYYTTNNILLLLLYHLFIGQHRGKKFGHGLHLKWVPTFLAKFLTLPKTSVRMYVQCTELGK